MLEKPCLTTVKLKNISKQEVSYLRSHFGLYLNKELKFSKKIFSFTDLGLHFDCVKIKVIALSWQKLNFFMRKNLSKKRPIFYKLKMHDKLLSSIYTLKQK